MSNALSSIAARKIATVSRIYSYIGWPFLVLWGAMTVVSVLLIPIVLFVKTDDPGRWWALGAAPVFGVMALLAYLYVKTGKRLKARDPQAATTARLLALPLLLGFPIFTVASIYCLNLFSYYPAFLAEAD